MCDNCTATFHLTMKYTLCYSCTAGAWFLRTRSSSKWFSNGLQELAAQASIAPINVCNDSLLWQLARKRPAQLGQLAMCEGASHVFRETYGKVGCFNHGNVAEESLTRRYTCARAVPGGR